jgi:hypothetical protein
MERRSLTVSKSAYVTWLNFIELTKAYLGLDQEPKAMTFDQFRANPPIGKWVSYKLSYTVSAPPIRKETK